MICLIMYVYPLLSTHSEGRRKPLCKSIPTLVSGFGQVFGADPSAMFVAINDYGFLLFFIMYLESVFKWGLSTIKVVVELKFIM